MITQEVLYLIAHILVATLAAMHVLRHQTRSNSALLWIIFLYSFPVFGVIAYIFLGINRLLRNEEVLQSVRQIQYPAGDSHAVAGQCEAVVDELRGVNLLSANLTQVPLSEATGFEYYSEGKHAYEDMLHAIREAKSSIYLCTFIFNLDKIGKRFADELVEAERRGVSVFIIIDGLGQWYSANLARPYLKKKGLNVKTFLPVTLFPPNIYINLRNHRKLLIVDYEHAFLGGLNISDAYYAEVDSDCKRDLHFKLRGEVARQLAAVFESDWAFISRRGSAILQRKMFANHDSPGAANDKKFHPLMACRTIIDDPGRRIGHLPLILFGAINNARHSVRIITPYFLPNGELISALNAAALRGVDVTVILPSKNNYAPVHFASRHTHEQMLSRGVKILYQPPPFAHSKLFVVDNNYALIGSANFDPRSFRLNYEIGVEIYDNGVASQLNEYIDGLLQDCRQVTPEALRQRSLPVKVMDGIAWLFTPLL